MNRLVNSARLAAMIVLIVILVIVYLVFLYQLQIIEGEAYYNRSNEITTDKKSVTAARGNILDRYGRVLATNKECYNLEIDTTKLFDSEDPNATILELVELVSRYGDTYTDDLPITAGPPFEYTEMTDLQRTMLNAYFDDKKLDRSTSAVELLSYMRGRYKIDNSYSSEEMRIIAGVRYGINVRYAINTDNYIFVQDASMQLITSIMESKLVGINVTRAYVRDVKTEYAAHLLGYVGLMTQAEYEKYSLLEYANNAFVGKDGIEYAFESYLHGKDGEVMETKNPQGTVLATVYTQEPEPGNHIYLTIDITLQEQVERILNNGVQALIRTREQKKAEQTAFGMWTFNDGYWEITGAAACVVDVKTGEPLAIASWPTYDPSNVIENYGELLKADNNPLFNRALLGAYAPGSAFKPCTAMACLTEGIINTEKKIKCQGVFTRYAAAGYAPECWIWSLGYTHPELDVTHALLHSCNYFFYSIVNDLGVTKLGEYAHKFGLGSSTGIELVETLGNMSNEANHMDYAGQEWRIGDTLQAGIGQSDSIFSPIQLAEYCATVANSGTRHSASILKSVRTFDYGESLYEREPKVMAEIQSADYNWFAVHEGMKLVANDLVNNEAVAINFYDCAKKCAAKTGTAQKGENIINDAIFICYVPYDDPQIAIAMVVERGEAGSNCAFMARQIVDAYLMISSYNDVSESEMSLLK
ncbi:MAG: hypothetical protein K5771_07255 [Oscillospiraceae bacterium]|nr:hypothetical protein [Oscillospiraceae bacterium]